MYISSRGDRYGANSIPYISAMFLSHITNISLHHNCDHHCHKYKNTIIHQYLKKKTNKKPVVKRGGGRMVRALSGASDRATHSQAQPSSAKLVSAMRPAAKIVTISPNINVSRQVSLLWGVQSINSRDANGWRDMMSISKEIIKKLKFVKKNDFVVITAGLPFGKAGMTNMVRLYKVKS